MSTAASSRVFLLGVLASLGLLGIPRVAKAHELTPEILRGEATVVLLTYADGTEFSYEAYEIYPPNAEIPFQTGRTDARGRIVFIPDRPGTWRLKTFSEDGHGTELEIGIDEAGLASVRDRPLFDRFLRPFVGAAVILGAFALLQLLLRRRSS